VDGPAAAQIVREVVTAGVVVGISSEAVTEAEMLRRTTGQLEAFYPEADLPEPLRDYTDVEGMLRLPTADADQPAVPAFSLGSGALLALHRCVLGTALHDIPPGVARRPGAIAQATLGKHGDSLASVLHRVRSSHATAADPVGIVDHIEAGVPGFGEVETEEMSDGNVTCRVREPDMEARMGRNQVSYGTLRLLCYHALLTSHALDEEPSRGPSAWYNRRGVCTRGS